MKLADLKPAPYNPRKISKQALAGLSASLHEFGDISGIVWNQRTGHLVAGHQRVELLKRKGEAVRIVENGNPYECTLIEEHTGHRYPVRIVDWSDAQEQAANIAANNPHIAGEFEQDALDKIIANLGQTDYAELLKPLRIDELLSPKALQVDEDEVPEPPEEPITKPGDMWTLGEHRVLCGDCLAESAISDGEHFDLTLTDPPYNVGRAYTKATNDSLDAEAYEAWCRQWFALCMATSDRLAFSCGHPNIRMWATIDRWHWMLCWYKGNAMLGSPFGFSNWEPILFYGKPHRPKGHDVISVPIVPNADLEAHDCPKQLGWGVKLLELLSEPHDSVLDPFLGSGTTLIAAEQLGRRCYGIEIEPRYVDCTVKRWEQLTGRKATR